MNLHVSGLWEETGLPRGKTSGCRENMVTVLTEVPLYCTYKTCAVAVSVKMNTNALMTTQLECSMLNCCFYCNPRFA